MTRQYSTPCYAVLGSTGNCGSALVHNLLQLPNVNIKAYCRQRSKLYRLVPGSIDNKRIEVFEGQITDVDLIGDCIRGCKTIFMVVTTNDNIPGCRVSEDLARSVIAALETTKKTGMPGAVMPKLVLLSSATIDDHLARRMPWWFRPIMLTAASFLYDDLRRTEEFLRAQSDWISTIFIKPGGLSVDISRGHKLSLDEEDTFISYYDLAGAMIEAAEDPEGRFDMKNVGVKHAAQGLGARFPSGTPRTILMGLLRHYFPPMHPYLPSGGPH
ncbi:Oxidoreductase dmxR7 [Cladophialophora chaetospira]|uniref:Oxidoreductase dmxR7 n=1 Tax=Cladophialophora chaetospira TaxID=386627 RepID=A0AA38X360_9EURO|nr:Oxidoreductase dmxR7 [Cladophialophora chaetospira]